MMVPKKSLILAGAALAMLGASSGAQSQSGKVFARYNKPMKSVALDLATGTLTHVPSVHDKTLATCAGFSNVDLGGFVGVDTGNKFCEWFDAGENAGCSSTDMIRSILFAYCSATTSVGSGGAGGSARLGFYEGYTVGGGTPTTTCVVFTLTGLPGNTADSSFFGGFRCYFIRVTFDPVINCAKGRIAYSWHFMDLGRDGVLASTFPFLSCVQSCSGTGMDGQGMIDFIDEYCPSGVGPPRATFSFGTTPFGSYFTSISMQIEKLVAVPCTAAQTAGDNAGCNVCNWVYPGGIQVPNIPAPAAGQVYPKHNIIDVAGGTAACLGGTWAPQVQLNLKGPHLSPPSPGGGVHGGGAQIATYRLFQGKPTNGPCPANVFAPYTARVELGIQGFQVLQLAGAVSVGPPKLTSVAAQTVPKDLSFLKFQWACYVDIITGQVRCRSKTLFGDVGAQ